MNKVIFSISLFLVLLKFTTISKVNFDTPNSTLKIDTTNFNGYEFVGKLLKKAKLQNWSKFSIGDVVAKVGTQLVGIPYVGGTLDNFEDKEVCTINMNGLDCVTFFESSLAIARLIKAEKTDPNLMMSQIEFTRYRGGKIGDYSTRLHYTSDLIYDNHKKNVVTDITKSFKGSIKFNQLINFMGTHPNSYKQLKNDTSLIKKIISIESIINKRKLFHLPKENVALIENQLKSGDIIAITTSIKGLDCSHTGLCVRDSTGTIKFMHASLTKKQVVIDTSLSEYLKTVSKHIGIIVARPKY